MKGVRCSGQMKKVITQPRARAKLLKINALISSLSGVDEVRSLGVVSNALTIRFVNCSLTDSIDRCCCSDMDKKRGKKRESQQAMEYLRGTVQGELKARGVTKNRLHVLAYRKRCLCINRRPL